MATTISPQVQAQIDQIKATDPEFQRLLGTGVGPLSLFAQYYLKQKYGIDLGASDSHLNPSGNVQQNQGWGSMLPYIGLAIGAPLAGALLGPTAFGSAANSASAASAAPTLGGGDTLAANLGGASALPSMGDASALSYIPPGAAATEPMSPNYVPPGAAAATDASSGIPISQIVKKLAQVGIPVGTAIAAHNGLLGGSGSGASNTPPELSQLLSMTMNRMASQQPLFDAVTKQAYAGLPNYAKGS